MTKWDIHFQPTIFKLQLSTIDRIPCIVRFHVSACLLTDKNNFPLTWKKNFSYSIFIYVWKVLFWCVRSSDQNLWSRLKINREHYLLTVFKSCLYLRYKLNLWSLGLLRVFKSKLHCVSRSLLCISFKKVYYCRF